MRGMFCYRVERRNALAGAWEDPLDEDGLASPFWARCLMLRQRRGVWRR